jgi:sugar O-acyltransferase (sialic acid O-acetyltransferase NeuD family)
MISVTIPTTDVNSESAEILRWYVEDRVEVKAGEALVEIETSKAILDVEAPEAGVLLQAGAAGDQLRLDQPLGFLFESLDALEIFERQRAEAPIPRGEEHAERITSPARRRADELGVDVEELARSTDQLITTKLVETVAARSAADAGGLPDPLQARPGVRRLVIIGAGLGATQVLDILLHDQAQQAVGVVDDDVARLGDEVGGVPVLGGVDRALELFAQRAFDAAVISISTSVPARARLRERCERAGLRLANVIDPTARIATDVRIGAGNVVCANCHFGVGTIVGDNNFISAYNSFDHHSVLGSDISTGPGCMTSGLVEIGDRCRLGTGIFIEPKVSLGVGVQVASGSVIVSSVPADHAVKTSLVTTTVVPIRRG